MMKNKIGSIFLVSMLALAGLGVSYAGFSDVIFVSGTVETAELDLEVISYSGTWVYKIIDTHGIEERTVPYDPIPPGYMYVASSYAQLGGPGEVVFVFDNLFPCVDFKADFVFEYEGTIPARLWADITTTDPWLLELWAIPDAVTIEYEIWDNVNLEWDPLIITENGYQVHGGEMIKIWLTIHLPQDNYWQGRIGSFNGYIYAFQWNEIPTLPPIP